MCIVRKEEPYFNGSLGLCSLKERKLQAWYKGFSQQNSFYWLQKDANQAPKVTTHLVVTAKFIALIFFEHNSIHSSRSSNKAVTWSMTNITSLMADVHYWRDLLTI